MEHSDVELLLLDYIEGVLIAEQAMEIEQHIASCPSCEKLYREYLGTMKLENLYAMSVPSLTRDLSVDIMGQISKESLCPTAPSLPHPRRTRIIIGSMSALNVVLTSILGLMIYQTSFGNPTLLDDVSRAIPVRVASLELPPTYRSVEVELDRQSAELVNVRQNAHVDVRCAYADGGRTRTADIARLVRIVDFDQGSSESAKKSDTVTLTLAVPEDAVKQIALAKVLGEVVIEMVEAPPSTKEDHFAMPIIDPHGRRVTDSLAPNTLAVLYTENPKTGASERRVFNQGTWELAAGPVLTAF